MGCKPLEGQHMTMTNLGHTFFSETVMVVPILSNKRLYSCHSWDESTYQTKRVSLLGTKPLLLYVLKPGRQKRIFFLDWDLCFMLDWGYLPRRFGQLPPAMPLVLDSLLGAGKACIGMLIPQGHLLQSAMKTMAHLDGLPWFSMSRGHTHATNNSKHSWSQ